MKYNCAANKNTILIIESMPFQWNIKWNRCLNAKRSNTRLPKQTSKGKKELQLMIKQDTKGIAPRLGVCEIEHPFVSAPLYTINGTFWRSKGEATYQPMKGKLWKFLWTYERVMYMTLPLSSNEFHEEHEFLINP